MEGSYSLRTKFLENSPQLKLFKVLNLSQHLKRDLKVTSNFRLYCNYVATLNDSYYTAKFSYTYVCDCPTFFPELTNCAVCSV